VVAVAVVEVAAAVAAVVAVEVTEPTAADIVTRPDPAGEAIGPTPAWGAATHSVRAGQWEIDPMPGMHPGAGPLRPPGDAVAVADPDAGGGRVMGGAAAVVMATEVAAAADARWSPASLC